MKSISKVIKVLSYIKKGSQLKKYGKILEYARSNGYHILALDYWFTHLEEFYNKKLLILRHDVDQMPSSALAIASVEKKHSVNSTFYFRWSTAKGKVINKIKEMGSTIGFHYETLTRHALVNGLNRPEEISPQVVKECKEKLKKEIDLFKELFGEITSIAHHGDPISYKIGLKNSFIVEGENPKKFGIKFFALDELLIKLISQWISESRDVSIIDVINKGYSPILFNTHPHCWVNGISYLVYRFSRRLKALFLLINTRYLYLIPHTEIPCWRKLWKELY